MSEDAVAEPSSTEPTQATERGKKGRLFWRLYTLFVIGAFLALPVGACLFVVWLPDSIPPHEWRTVGRAALPRGQEVYVFQKWDSDFYVTAIATKEKGRPAQVYVVDGDDTKQWWADMQPDPSAGQITVTLSRGRVFRYSAGSGELLEAGYPRCGTPINEFELGTWPPFPIDEGPVQE